MVADSASSDRPIWARPSATFRARGNTLLKPARAPDGLRSSQRLPSCAESATLTCASTGCSPAARSCAGWGAVARALAGLGVQAASGPADGEELARLTSEGAPATPVTPHFIPANRHQGHTSSWLCQQAHPQLQATPLQTCRPQLDRRPRPLVRPSPVLLGPDLPGEALCTSLLMRCRSPPFTRPPACGAPSPVPPSAAAAKAELLLVPLGLPESLGAAADQAPAVSAGCVAAVPRAHSGAWAAGRLAVADAGTAAAAAAAAAGVPATGPPGAAALGLVAGLEGPSSAAATSAVGALLLLARASSKPATGATPHMPACSRRPQGTCPRLEIDVLMWHVSGQHDNHSMKLS
jgi:hypothetical protein